MKSLSPIYGDGPGSVLIISECSKCRRHYAIFRGFSRKNDIDVDLIATDESDSSKPIWCILPASSINKFDSDLWQENANMNPICPNCRQEFTVGQSAVVTSAGDLLLIPYFKDM